MSTTSLETGYSEAQQQTSSAFGFKWSQRQTYESAAMQEAGRRWLFERYCGGDPAMLAQWLAGGRKRILDAGCGAGYSALLFFGDHLACHDYLGVDISDAADVARRRFQERGYQGSFLKTSLDDPGIPADSFDIVFSEGVLHHTDDTAKSLAHLATRLKSGGRLLFYVYAKKSVLREFTDDHIREALRPLSDQEAWDALYALTKLGIALGKLQCSLEIEEDIPLLGIQKGRLDLQRFFYWHVCKAFYRDDLTLDEMNHINFDWYRPLNCHRHTPGEVRDFCSAAGLTIERLHVEEAGITVVARR